MAWTTPKTDWTTVDGVDYNDLNRIESDISFIATNPSGINLQLAPDGGRVLVGTPIDDTTYKLQVSGGLSVYSGNALVSGDEPSLIVVDEDGASGRRIIFKSTDTESTINSTWATGSAPFKFQLGNTTAFEISTNRNLLIGTTADPGEALHIGAGGARITGTLPGAVILLNATGAIIDYTYPSVNYLRAQGVGGSLALVTNGRATTPANANVELNADQTTSFKKAVDIAEGGLTVTGTNWDVSIAATGQLTTGYLQVDDAPIGLYTSSVQYGDIGETGGNDLIIRALKSTGEIILQSHSAGLIRMKNYVYCEDNLNISTGNILAVNTINESTASVGVTFLAEANFDDVVNCSAEVKFKYYYSATTVTYGDIYDELVTVLTTTGDVLILDGYITTVADKYRVFSARKDGATSISVKVSRVNIDDNFEELTMFTGSMTAVSSVKLTANYDKV
ncbi:MAG: hypothetical protein GY861_25515 [bacterium]|nr:hypothetical protein [bacterium]